MKSSPSADIEPGLVLGLSNTTFHPYSIEMTLYCPSSVLYLIMSVPVWYKLKGSNQKFAYHVHACMWTALSRWIMSSTELLE